MFITNQYNGGAGGGGGDPGGGGWWLYGQKGLGAHVQLFAMFITISRNCS